MRGEQERSRIGVYGGSFDPIHLAHLLLAERAREELALEKVVFVPAADQPLKPGEGIAPVEHRVEMVRLAIEGNPYFELSRVDVDRHGPSYTVDTLRHLCDLHGGPDRAELWFIIGADSLATFVEWRDPLGILAQAKLAVLRRPGYEPNVTAIYDSLPKLASRTEWVEAPLVDISSSEIRERLAAGRSVRYLVPRVVLKHIEAHALYRRARAEG